MKLKAGRIVQTETLGNLKVIERLGEGRQGVVYRVEGKHGQQALKWYFPQFATSIQRESISTIINEHSIGLAEDSFVWPLDLVNGENEGEFGYVMNLIDKKRFAELEEVWARIKPRPTYSTQCEISYQVANSYRALHLNGLFYCDISHNNILFDPYTGAIQICDLDNVGVDHDSKTQVGGTLEYMAPEVILGKAFPSIAVDRHALAVWLFHLWMAHHPMDGEIEHSLKSWDIPAKVLVYGEKATFIFDTNNSSNRLPNDYSWVKKLWNNCPSSLQRLFTHAFTVGIHEPSNRVSEGQWQRLFLQLKDGIVLCPKCRGENFWEKDEKLSHCWHCRKKLTTPPALRFTYSSGEHYFMLGVDTNILKRHLDLHVDETVAKNIVGRVVQHPRDPNIFGIKNLTKQPWTARFHDGTTTTVPPQKSAPISLGLKLFIQGVEAEIVQV